MTALLRFRSCAIAIAGWVLDMFIPEDRPAHSGEALDYQGPRRDDDESGWWV